MKLDGFPTQGCLLREGLRTPLSTLSSLVAVGQKLWKVLPIKAATAPHLAPSSLLASQSANLEGLLAVS